jgi:hypothetical protein
VRVTPIFEALSDKCGVDAKFFKVNAEGFKGAISLM